jgi:hypothetical protein
MSKELMQLNTENLLWQIQTTTDTSSDDYSKLYKLYDSVTPKGKLSYFPVSYKHLHELTTNLIHKHGYIILDVKVKLGKCNKDGIINTFITTFSLSGKGNPSEEYTKMIAIQSSHDKSTSIRIVGGSYVNICTNGNIFGEIIEVRKHTKNVLQDINDKFESCIKGLEKNYSDFVILADDLRKCKITANSSYGLVGIIYCSLRDNGIELPLKILDNIYKNMTKTKPTNAWLLYNIYTDCFKEVNVEYYIKAHSVLLNVFKDYVELIKNRSNGRKEG